MPESPRPQQGVGIPFAFRIRFLQVGGAFDPAKKVAHPALPLLTHWSPLTSFHNDFQGSEAAGTITWRVIR
jgi:hypothetical protein